MMRAGSARSTAIAAVLAALGVLLQAAFGAEPEITAIHASNFARLGRIVVDVGGKPTFKLDRVGNHVVVRFNDAITLDRAPLPPRNVVSIATDGPTVELIVAPGTSIHPTIISGHIAFDILDPPVATPSQASTAAPRSGVDKPAKPAPPSPINLTMVRSPELGGRGATHPVPPSGQPNGEAKNGAKPLPATQPATGEAPRAVTTQPLPSPSGPADAPDEPALEAIQPAPPGRDVMPETASALGLLARRTKLPKGLEGSAFLVPFANTTGAAVFQRGGRTFVVFDERRPVDMAALRADPVFGQTTVQLLPNGTLLRLPVPPGVSIALFQTPQGWRIAGLAAAAKTQPIVATSVDGAMSLGAEQPGDVISMADPDTGATLLVGTQRRPGQGVATTRRTTEFVLRATGLGVVVEPLSDTIVLKVVPTGFILSGGAGGLAVSPTTADTEALMQAAHLTRRLNFSTVPAAPLMQLMKRQIADAAAAQPQARGPKRRAVAQSMIALGMAAEAESLLDVAAEQDPRQAASADVTALKAVAALLAGRPADAEGINDPRLTGTDDIALWRAVRQAMLDEGSPSAAAIFASTAPLALLYPKPIADQILPLIIETMIQGGKVTAAAQLLAQRKDDHRLDYARALQQQAEGHTDQALALLDELAAGHDRFDRARAATRAVELRLASHKIDASQAADALDKLIYVWRGDQRELALRERIAELRGQSGSWRVALSTLRQAETDFPDQAGCRARPVEASLCQHAHRPRSATDDTHRCRFGRR